MSNWEHASEAELAAGREAYSVDDPKHPDYADTLAADLERVTNDLDRELEKGEAMELAKIEPQTVTLFGSDEPEEVIAQATKVAEALAEKIQERHLYVTIGKSDHVRVEGWTLLGTLLGVFPYTVWTRVVQDPRGPTELLGWEARVEARTRSGEVVGAAEAECLYAEANWKGRDDYALRSMAQTRATSKALRMPLGFVVSLAGFDPTPAEEMTGVQQTSGESPFRPPSELLAGELLTERQQKAIYALHSKLVKAGALDEETFDRTLADDYGATISGLTKVQASELIERLDKLKAERGL